MCIPCDSCFYVISPNLRLYQPSDVNLSSNATEKFLDKSIDTDISKKKSHEKVNLATVA